LTTGTAVRKKAAEEIMILRDSPGAAHHSRCRRQRYKRVTHNTAGRRSAIAAGTREVTRLRASGSAMRSQLIKYPPAGVGDFGGKDYGIVNAALLTRTEATAWQPLVCSILGRATAAKIFSPPRE